MVERFSRLCAVCYTIHDCSECPRCGGHNEHYEKIKHKEEFEHFMESVGPARRIQSALSPSTRWTVQERVWLVESTKDALSYGYNWACRKLASRFDITIEQLMSLQGDQF